MANQNDNSQSGFWFGLMMGGIIGGGALYFLGTKEGRVKLRSLLETIEGLDVTTIDEIAQMFENAEEGGKKTVPDIHAVLDKIQSSLPTRTEVQKFFAKDGKILK